MFRSPWIRAVIAAIYAAPASIAGWHLVYGLFRIAGTGEPWHSGFAWIGGVLIAGVAWSASLRSSPRSRRRASVDVNSVGAHIMENGGAAPRPPSIGPITGAIDRPR